MLTTPPPSDLKLELAERVRERLWRYLSANADMLRLGSVVEDLFQLPRGEARRLAAVHLALSPTTEEMLRAAERLLRELPSSIARVEVEAAGAVRPPIAWTSTLLTRARTGRQTQFITRPPERRYDTSLARLLKLALTQCGELSQIAALPASGSVGLTIEERSLRALHLLRHVKLEHVRLPRRLPSSTARLAARHAASAIPDFAARHADAIDNQAPAAMREVISEQLLAPTEIDRLFELYVGFELIDGLLEVGYRDVGVRLIPGRDVPFARLRGDGSPLEMWWQRPIWKPFKALRSESAYRRTLSRAGISQYPLRPDFIVTDVALTRVLIVEVKFTSIEDETPERRGVQDALAYLMDASAVVRECPAPYALVAAWNATGKPAPSEIVVSSQADVRQAIQMIVSEWERGEATA